MGKVRNILFIMCDQLRADYLGCTGHPAISTPNIDALAARGVNFTRAYCQAPVCGPSRMSFYTGRYMVSHGSTYNNVPLSVGELTLGDYMRDLGVRTGPGRQDPHAGRRRRLAAPRRRHPIHRRRLGARMRLRALGARRRPAPGRRSPIPTIAYNRYLRDQGYEGDNPWHTVANSRPRDRTERFYRAGRCAIPTCRRASPRSIRKPPT